MVDSCILKFVYSPALASPAAIASETAVSRSLATEMERLAVRWPVFPGCSATASQWMAERRSMSSQFGRGPKRQASAMAAALRTAPRL